MPHLTLLLYRVSPDWTLAIRRLFQRSVQFPVEFVELESSDEFELRLAESPAALVVMELTERDAQRIIGSLQRCRTGHPAVRSVVAGPRAAWPWEWVLREAGAVWTTFSPRQLRPLLSIAHLQAALAAQR